MPATTLLDIVKANGNDPVVGLIDETIKVHPEISLLPARPIRGINYQTFVRTSLGRVTGSFRNANEGTTAIKNRYERRMVETFIMEPRFEIDKAVADRHEDGAKAYIAMETQGILEGEMQGLCSQFYYGTTLNGTKAFPGLIDSYDATNMVIDAGGSTANTGSSVWLVRSTGVQDLTWVWGQGGQLTFSEVRRESIIDPLDPQKKFDGYVQTMQAYPGLQLSSTRLVVRIKNLTNEVGKGLDDKLLNRALAMFPAGLGPNHIFATQRSGSQLQMSRTATTPTGQPAPFPTAITGLDGTAIPLHVTDAITNTESLTL